MARFLDIETSACCREEPEEADSARELSPVPGAATLGRAWGRWAAGASAVLLFTCAAAWAVGAPLSGAAKGSQATSASMELVEETFLCHEDAEHWQSDWSEKQKTYCCMHEQIGCEEGLSALGQKFKSDSNDFQGASTRVYDCSAGADNWAINWSNDQKDYCCTTVHIGCENRSNWKWVVLGIVCGALICILISVLSRGTCAVCTLLCLVTSIATKVPCLRKHATPLFREVVAVLVIMFLTVEPFLISPFYSAAILGYSPREIWSSDVVHSDTRPVLMLSALMTASHSTLPIRWILLLPLEVFTVAVYAAFGLILGGPDGTLAWTTMGLYSILVIASALGRRTIEYHQREALSQVILERQLRAESEFRLTRFEQSNLEDRHVSWQDELSSAQQSRPDTTPSAKVFQSAAQSGDLQKVIEVGRHEQWLIDRKELKLMAKQMLGKGGFGMVVVGRYVGAPVAVKLMPEASSRRQDCKDFLGSFLREIQVLRRLHHPGIASFYGVCIDIENGSASLVLEWVRGLCLERFILQGGVPDCPLTAASRLKAILDTCWAVCYLHSRQPSIVHGDLKGTNVIMEKDPLGFSSFRAKLLDFGLSRVLTKHVGGMGGTLMWAAPEVVGQRLAHSSADVFSFGRLSFFVLTGIFPLGEFSRKQILLFLQSGSLPRLPWPATSSRPVEECRWWIEACSNSEPSGRPRMEVVAKSLTEALQRVDCEEETVDRCSEDLEENETLSNLQPGASETAQSDQQPVAEVVLDVSTKGWPIKECSPGFTQRLGQVATETHFVRLLQNANDFEAWLESSFNALMYKEEPPDLCITLNVPEGLMEAMCRVMPESGTHVKDSEIDNDDESRVSVDMTNVIIQFCKIRHGQSDGKATADPADPPASRMSL